VPSDPSGPEDGSLPESEEEPKLSYWDIALADWKFDYANQGKDWDTVPIPDTLPQDMENMCGKLEN